MAPSQEKFLVVLTTAGSEEQARQIARVLVERRLAACVNIVAHGCSIYRWKGEIQEEEEKLLVIKSSRRLFERVRETIRAAHSYDVPEVLALPVEEGDPDYLVWMADSLAGD